MRDLCEVINELLLVIPEEKSELKEILEDKKQSIEIAPPEMIFSWWNEIGDILYNHVFSDFYPEIAWQAEVEKIWIGDEYPEDLSNSNF